MAIKIESRAAYIGTVMNALTDFPMTLALAEIFRHMERSRVEGGVG